MYILHFYSKMIVFHDFLIEGVPNMLAKVFWLHAKIFKNNQETLEFTELYLT